MTKDDQVKLARVLMNRLDGKFDKNTVKAIRRKHPCGIPKPTQDQISKIKNEFSNNEDRIKAFIDCLNGSMTTINEKEYFITWGITECVCGMFRNLKDYEFISPSWCECCNGHNKLLFESLLEQEVDSELLGGICAGNKNCAFKITIK